MSAAQLLQVRDLALRFGGITALAGVDLKNYTLDDYQAFGFLTGTPLNIFNPNYSGQGVYGGAPYQDSFRKLRQVGVVSARSDQIRSLHAAAHRAARYNLAKQ